MACLSNLLEVPKWRPLLIAVLSLQLAGSVPVVPQSSASPDVQVPSATTAMEAVASSAQEAYVHPDPVHGAFSGGEKAPDIRTASLMEDAYVHPDSVPDVFAEKDNAPASRTASSMEEAYVHPDSIPDIFLKGNNVPTSKTTSFLAVVSPTSAVVAATQIVDEAILQNLDSHILQKRAKWPATFRALINLVNGTPYQWRRGYNHAYQIGNWESDWPKVIEPGASAEVFANAFGGAASKDTAGEVVYHIMGTSKPMSFMVEYRNGKEHEWWIRFIDNLETKNTRKGSELNLGLQRDPGGVGFLLAGTEGDFVSNDAPVGWMQAQLPEIGGVPLREIIMPMSHHAGLWKSVVPVGFGVPKNTQTHDEPLWEQMTNGGVRVLDVRPAKYNGEWRESHGTKIAGVYHGMLGAKLLEMIDMVNQFCREHPGELIIWDIHATDAWNGENFFKDLGDWERHFLYETLMKLEHRASVPDDEDLTLWPLERFVGNKTSAVLLRFNRSWAEMGGDFPGGAEGFATSDSLPVAHRWSETGNISKMAEDQVAHLRASRPRRQSRLFRSDWLLTQVGRKAVFPQQSLRTMAKEAMAALFSRLWGQLTDRTYPNWVTVDGVQGNELKSWVVAANHCYVARRCGKLGGRVKVRNDAS